MSDVDALFLQSRSGGSLGGISPTFIGNLLIGTTWSYVTGGPEFTNQPVSIFGVANGGTAVFTGDAVAAAQTVNYLWQHVVGGVTNDLTDGVGTAGGGATVSVSATDTLTLAGVTDAIILVDDEALPFPTCDQELATALVDEQRHDRGVLIEIDEHPDRFAVTAPARQFHYIERIEFSVGAEQEKF